MRELIKCGSLLGVLKVVHHKLVHLQIDVSPLIGFNPSFVVIQDDNLIFVIKTYSANRLMRL